MKLRIQHDSIAVYCEDYPTVNWANPKVEDFQLREGTHVWLVDNKTFTTKEVAAFWEVLSFKEKEKALRFHFERDRKRYVLTHGILRKLIGKYFKTQDELMFSENEFGKPYLVQYNIDSKTLFEFNISHSSNLILMAFRFSEHVVLDSEFQVGIDIEKVQQDFDFELILDNFFSKKEIESIHSSTIPNNAFFNFWTKKEALVKAAGRGLMRNLNQFDLSKKKNKWDLDREVFLKFNSNNFFLHSFKIENYVASIALMSDDSPFSFFKYKN